MSESSIGLKSFFEYEGRTPPRDVKIISPDFFLPDDLILPKTGLTFLYGFRGAQAVLGHAMRRSMESGKELCVVSAQADVGNWSLDKQKLGNFDEFGFLNLPGRVRAETLDDIAKRWKILLTKHGHPIDEFPRKQSPYMYLLDELVKQEPYDKLTAIAYPIKTKVGNARLVTVFKLDKIRDIEANTVHKVRVKFDLPPEE
ncbi:hypothetical protein ACSSVV_001510 [Marinobacter sp. MBR-105]|jgi:hypothetical protein